MTFEQFHHNNKDTILSQQFLQQFRFHGAIQTLPGWSKVKTCGFKFQGGEDAPQVTWPDRQTGAVISTRVWIDNNSEVPLVDVL